jgi:hypothetical protein
MASGSHLRWASLCVAWRSVRAPQSLWCFFTDPLMEDIMFVKHIFDYPSNMMLKQQSTTHILIYSDGLITHDFVQKMGMVKTSCFTNIRWYRRYKDSDVSNIPSHEVQGVEELIPFGSRIISWGNDQEILTVRCWSALGRRTHRVPVTSSACGKRT